MFLDSIFWVPQYSIEMYSIFRGQERLLLPEPGYLQSGGYCDGGFDSSTRAYLVDAMVRIRLHLLPPLISYPKSFVMYLNISDSTTFNFQISICEDSGMRRDTLCLAIHLVDRYLSSTTLTTCVSALQWTGTYFPTGKVSTLNIQVLVYVHFVCAYRYEKTIYDVA